MPEFRAQAVAVGAHLPERVLSNKDLEQMVETNDEWIVSRTGIRERRIVEPGTPLSALAIPAAQQCLERAGISGSDVDGIIVATITGDHVMPTTANLVQHAIGATGAWAYDLANACNGFVAAVGQASAMIECGRSKRILIIGGDIMSSVVDYTDRNTCILFGDGCGAVLLEAGPADGPGVVDTVLHSDGGHGDLLCIPSSGSAKPPSAAVLETGAQYVKQEGRDVFKHAVRRMAEAAGEIMERNELTSDDVDLLIPHQANLRIIEPTARRVGLPMDKVVVNIDRVANTTAGTIPLAIFDAVADGRIQNGTRLMLAAFGGGFSWGASYLTWGRGE